MNKLERYRRIVFDDGEVAIEPLSIEARQVEYYAYTGVERPDPQRIIRADIIVTWITLDGRYRIREETSGNMTFYEI